MTIDLSYGRYPGPVTADILDSLSPPVWLPTVNLSICYEISCRHYLSSYFLDLSSSTLFHIILFFSLG